jgi:hypothetical protein
VPLCSCHSTCVEQGGGRQKEPDGQATQVLDNQRRLLRLGHFSQETSRALARTVRLIVEECCNPSQDAGRIPERSQMTALALLPPLLTGVLPLATGNADEGHSLLHHEIVGPLSEAVAAAMRVSAGAGARNSALPHGLKRGEGLWPTAATVRRGYRAYRLWIKPCGETTCSLGGGWR